MNYIKINEHGVLEEQPVINPMTAGNNLVNNVYILNALDQESTTPYYVTAFVKRSDGFIIGPVAVNEVAVPEEFQNHYIRARLLTLTDEMLAVEGDVEFSLIYDKYENGVKTETLVTVKNVLYCNESVRYFFNDTDAYEQFKATLLKKDFSGLDQATEIKGVSQIIAKTDGLTKAATITQVLNYLRTQETTKKVANVNTFFDSGCVMDDNNNIVFSVKTTVGNDFVVAQAGIINGVFEYRTYTGSAGVWENANDTIISGLDKYVLKSDYIADQTKVLKFKGGVNLTAMSVEQIATFLGQTSAAGYVYNLTTAFTYIKAQHSSFFLQEGIEGETAILPQGTNLIVVEHGGSKVFDLSMGLGIDAKTIKQDSSTVYDEINLLKDRPAFNPQGTYPDLVAGSAYNIEESAAYLKNTAFDLRVTAEEDTEVQNGIAKLKTIEASVTVDNKGTVTNITPKPSKLVATNDNWVKLKENFTQNVHGITVQTLSDGTVKFSGVSTKDNDSVLVELAMFKELYYNAVHSGIEGDLGAYLYAEVLSGSIDSRITLEYAPNYYVGTNLYALLDENLVVDIEFPALHISVNFNNAVGAEASDLIVRFYTKHKYNPSQNYVTPYPVEIDIAAMLENVSANDWFKENIVNFATGNFYKQWHKFTINGQETGWNTYATYGSLNLHILEIPVATINIIDALLTKGPADAPYYDYFNYIGRVTTYGASNMVSGDIGILFGADMVNGIVIAVEGTLTQLKSLFNNYNYDVWLKAESATQIQIYVDSTEYPCYNYGLEFGMLGNKAGIEYSRDYQKQITTNLENINDLRANKAITFTRNITIATTDWVDHTSGKKAVISVSGVVASDTPIVSLDCSESEDVNATRLEYAKIYNAETGAGTITFYATEALSEAVKIQIKVVR